MNKNDSTRSALVRKGNELFNQNDIEGAYRCYLTASYYGGIEKVADYYNFEKKNFIKAMQLYKFIMKEDSNLGGNIRAKQKLDKLSESVVKVLRKWLNKDKIFNNKENEKLKLYNESNISDNKNYLEYISKNKVKMYSKSKLNDEIKLVVPNNDKFLNIKKPVFEQIYKNKTNKK